MYANELKIIANQAISGVIAGVGTFTSITAEHFYRAAVTSTYSYPTYPPEGAISRVINRILKIDSNPIHFRQSINKISLFAVGAATILTAAMKLHENFVVRQDLSTKDALLDTLMCSAISGIGVFLSIKLTSYFSEFRDPIFNSILSAGLSGAIFTGPIAGLSSMYFFPQRDES